MTERNLFGVPEDDNRIQRRDEDGETDRTLVDKRIRALMGEGEEGLSISAARILGMRGQPLSSHSPKVTFPRFALLQ